MTKQILIATGGTGGHVYPAIALAQQVSREVPGVAVSFTGSGLIQNSFFDSEKWPCYEIDAASPSNGRGLFGKLGVGWAIMKGILQSRSLLKRLRPDVVVGFGSFHTFPVLLAARMCGVPVVLHEGNSIPGRVNRRFSRSAKVTGVQFPEAASALEGRVLELPLPLREGYSLAFGSKPRAREYYGLDPDRLTFLVFGGSQGALSMNILVCTALAHQLADTTRRFQVIHLAGSEAQKQQLEEEYAESEIQACVKVFEERMDQAWLAADLAISRAGASTIAEQLEFEVPAIYIPYPYAMDQHQDFNADFIAKTVGGGVKLCEKELEAADLADAIRALLREEQAKLRRMQRNLREYKETNHRRDLCSVVCEVAGVHGR